MAIDISGKDSVHIDISGKDSVVIDISGKDSVDIDRVLVYKVGGSVPDD